MADITNQQLLDKLNSLEANMATKDDIAKIYDVMATKDDLKRFATKDDIATMATKDDLKRFATKDDIATMATKDDLKRFATKDDIATMATKDDLANAVSRLERRIVESRQISTQHHLETRKLLGQTNRQIDTMRDRLSKAGDSLHGLA